MCTGALLRTETKELYEESKLEPMEVVYKKHSVRYVYRAYVRKPTFVTRIIDDSWSETVDEKVEEKEAKIMKNRQSAMGSVLQCMMTSSQMLTPVGEHWKESLNYLVQKEEQPNQNFWKYHRDFWKERTLARIRMGVLPTRKWAHKMKLSKSDKCRHCAEEVETIEHLFFDKCSKLNVHFCLWMHSIFSVGKVQEVLKDEERESREVLERALLRKIKQTNLFKKGNVSDPG